MTHFEKIAREVMDRANSEQYGQPITEDAILKLLAEAAEEGYNLGFSVPQVTFTPRVGW